MRTNRKLGWRRDIPDIRDKKLSFARLKLAPLPTAVQLEDGFEGIGVYDQGNLGSCTANAICGALIFTDIKQVISVATSSMPAIINPSRLFIYYCERAIEGTVASDSGAELRDGLKVVSTYGFPDERIWPYDPSVFTSIPPQTVFDAAILDKVLAYYKVEQSLFELKSCIADGYPFVFGISVYDSFPMSIGSNSNVELPQANEHLLGGHAILCTGYDDATQRFTFRNSWGPHWGVNGSGTLPYEYLTNPELASDFWTIRQETQ